MSHKITKQFLEQLIREYNYLKTVRKKQLIESQNENIIQGDDRENDGYILTSELIGQNDIRLGEIRTILDDYEIADEQQLYTVQLGATFTILNLTTGVEFTYKMVDSLEVNILENKISPASLLGSHVINKKAGDRFEFNNSHYKIIKVS